MKKIIWLSCFLAASGFAATPQSDIRAFTTAHQQAILDQFTELLKIPNIASDKEGIRRNADAITAMMQRLNLNPRLLTPVGTPDAPPVIYGEWKVPKAKRTLVVYAHYDGQPINPAEWTTGPFTPTLRDERIYARSASDDKAGVVVILTAIDALRSLHRHPTDNLKVVFEGEEEAGSPHLGEILKENRA
jgi:acetylornithine deacetylase/succinyl-diaminopimelate desuccinylase-like protein